MSEYPLPDLSALAAELDAGSPGLAIGGVVPGARCLAVAALAAGGWPKGRTLVVVPHVSEAADLAAGLSILAPGFPPEMTDDEPEEPGYEVIPKGRG